MAQPAAESKKPPLQNDAFWEKRTATPPLTWDKWTQQWKLALLAKEGIQLELLLKGPPANCHISTRTDTRGTSGEPYTSNGKGQQSSQSATQGKLAKSM